MKKTLALLLALAMSCSMLAACGEEDSSSKAEDSSSVAEESSKSDDSAAADESSDADNDSEGDAEGDESSEAEVGDAEGTKFEQLVKKINETGACTLSVSQEGLMDVYITTDGESAYADMSIFGIRAVELMTPDASYAIDADGKRYYATEPEETADDATELIDEFTGLDGYTYISTSTETIDGKEYTVETFKDEFDQEMGIAFDDDDNVCYMGQGGEYVEFIFTADADTSKLTLDESYTEMTEDEYNEWQESLLGGLVDGMEDMDIYNEAE